MKPVENIRDFLKRLGARGELQEIERQVETDQEIAAITDLVSKERSGGKALLFKRVSGYSWPVSTNLFGSTARVSMALNVPDIDQLGTRLADGLAKYDGMDPLEAFRQLIAEPAWRPVSKRRAPCREKKAAAGLAMLPALRNWPGEGGRFLTLPLVHTRDPHTSEVNCGMYRTQIIGSDCLTINWSESSDAARHYRAWSRKGEPMPVAISLGGPPAAICAAAMPLPPEVDEMAMAGYLNGEPVSVVGVGKSGLTVPSEAEIVIEGKIEPGESALEGPFGNHTGFYTQPKKSPMMRVVSVTHRDAPVYPCTVVGPPPMEDCYMARATERLFLALWQRMFPLLDDIHMPFEGVFHGCALVSARGEEPGRGAALIRQMWKSAAFRRSRLLVVVDGHIDVRNASEVFWSAVNRVDAARNLMVDGERIGIDATGYLPGGCAASMIRRSDEDMRRQVRERWHEYGFDE